MKSIIFDQYSRYQACADLLMQAGLTSKKTLIDVGSGPECLFGQFIPDVQITYVDPLIPLDSAQNFIAGDVFSTALDDKYFDCVTAVDVFEHVPPDLRNLFLQRLSSLGKDILVLGFPTSDSSEASKVDAAIGAQYEAVFGAEYSWLEEHDRYGLPSLQDTVHQLEKMGWYCNTIGHGHAPWLAQLLGLIVKVLHIPEMRKAIENISERFNRELYQYDFRKPYYRQFVLATRNPLHKLITPPPGLDVKAAEKIFKSLMLEAERDFLEVSINKIVNQDAFNSQEQQKIAQVSEWGRSMSQQVEAHAQRIEMLMQTIGERDTQITDYNAKIAQFTIEAEYLSSDILSKERDLQILDSETASLKAVVQQLEWKLHLSERKKMEISDWAQDISLHPFAYGFKHLAVGAVRKIWHHIPLNNAHKKCLRLFTKKLMGREVPKLKLENLTNDKGLDLEAKPNNSSKRDVFVFGVIDWHFRIQRPQHIARNLANDGRRVFYFSNHFIDSDEIGYQIESLSDVSNLYQIKLYVKGAPAIYFDPPSEETLSILTNSIAKVIRDFGATSSLSIVQHAFWFPLVKKIPNSYRIYDCMDHHEGFGNVPPKLIEIEEEMLHNADLVTVTSSWLEEFALKRNKNVAIVRNAAEYEHFAMRPEELYCDTSGRRIIGYYGAIAEWFDVDLVRSVALEYSDCAILLVGNDTIGAQSSLSDLPNVYFTGEVPYSMLPFYLHAFDVCMLPFKVIPLTLATNPVKVYEYLAAGKPVISIDLPEITQFGKLVSCAQSRNDFVLRIGELLKQSPEASACQSADRRLFASEQTWSHRGEEFLKAVESVKMPCVSVIILTFNNLDLTKACLESVLNRSEYTNLEVIVVDNASSDGTPAYLESLAQEHLNLRIVLNAENLGFAAGNNVGLKVATGDFLILLNNDTVVTQGWILTLLRYFQSNPNLGLLGPVTNNIGNEARIEITYSLIEDMSKEAQRYTLAHMGKIYPMRNAAFFCVMMSRSTYERCGPISEDYGRGFFEDDDYCRKVDEEGLVIACAEDVFVHHHLSASFSKISSIERNDLFVRNKNTYEKKWGKWIPHSYRS